MMAARSIALLALLAIVCATTVSAQRCGGVRGFFLETGSAEQMMAPEEEMYPAMIETGVGGCPHKCMKYSISATEFEMVYFSCDGANCDNCKPTEASMVACNNGLSQLANKNKFTRALANLIPNKVRESLKRRWTNGEAAKDVAKSGATGGTVTMCTTPTQLHCFEGVSAKSLMEVMAAKSLMEMEAEAAPKAGAGGAVKREHRCVGSGANKKCGVYRTTAADSARRVAQVTESRKKLAAMKADQKKKAAAAGKKPAAGKAGKPAAKKAAAGGKAGKKPKVKMLNQPPALSAGAAAGRKTSAGAAKGKKPAGKKPAAKKTVAKKTAGAKKPAARKPAARKAAPRKAAPRKAAPRKAAPRKAAPRKAAPRKAAPKKRSGPTAAQKQAAARKLAAQRKAAAAKGKKGKKRF